MTEPNSAPPQDPPLVELTPAPEIMVDGFSSSLVCAGIAKFNFFSTGFSADGTAVERRIVLRLAGALPVIAGVHDALGRFLAQVGELQAQAERSGDADA